VRRWLIVLLGAAWLIFGGARVWAYAHDYYVYRGFGPPRNPAGVPKGSLRHVTFRSAALGATRGYDVYLPPGYAQAARSGRRFAVMYLLHGSPGWPRLFMNAGALGVAMDTLVVQHRIRPFLVVMPDGRDGSLLSDTEWADTAHGRYAAFVLDVVHAVDRAWPTRADRAHRLLAGNSEGAYAAANLALRHPSMFGGFEAWSGYFRQTRSGVFAHASRAELAANSPIDLALRMRAQHAARGLRAFLYGGAQDPDTRQLMPFASALRAAGADVVARVRPGGHDWRLWREETPAMLRWAAATMGAGR
jgi:enterochelin esterase-like enzyme